MQPANLIFAEALVLAFLTMLLLGIFRCPWVLTKHGATTMHSFTVATGAGLVTLTIQMHLHRALTTCGPVQLGRPAPLNMSCACSAACIVAHNHQDSKSMPSTSSAAAVQLCCDSVSETQRNHVKRMRRNKYRTVTGALSGLAGLMYLDAVLSR